MPSILLRPAGRGLWSTAVLCGLLLQKIISSCASPPPPSPTYPHLPSNYVNGPLNHRTNQIVIWRGGSGLNEPFRRFGAALTFKSSSSKTLHLAVAFRPQLLFTMSSQLPCLHCYRTQSNKALLIEAGSPRRCPPPPFCLGRDVAISSEMSWKSCCHEVAQETESHEGNGL